MECVGKFACEVLPCQFLEGDRSPQLTIRTRMWVNEFNERASPFSTPCLAAAQPFYCCGRSSCRHSTQSFDAKFSQVHVVDHHIEQSSDINATSVVIEPVRRRGNN